MPYKAQINRAQPGCFLFLIDQSGSMGDPFVSIKTSKAQALADALNRMLHQLVVKCGKGDTSNPAGVRDYYDIAVLGYNENGILPALKGGLSGSTLHTISRIANNPLRIEQRTQKVHDGAGGLIEAEVRFPIWVEAVADGGTPMSAAFETAYRLLDSWVVQHRDSFPPIVIHITDAESTDGDPSIAMQRVRGLSTDDGALLLFNLHVSGTATHALSFPGSETTLPDKHAKVLFENASLMPDFMKEVARAEYNMSLSQDARTFVLNGDIDLIIAALNIGTTPVLALR